MLARDMLGHTTLWLVFAALQPDPAHHHHHISSEMMSSSSSSLGITCSAVLALLKGFLATVSATVARLSAPDDQTARDLAAARDQSDCCTLHLSQCPSHPTAAPPLLFLAPCLPPPPPFLHSSSSVETLFKKSNLLSDGLRSCDTSNVR
jgi:hypothetical protein